jgi:hypothetical protein
MQHLWWQLPGPDQFVLRVVQDLRDGKNVILCLPEHLPSGLAFAIRSALSEGEDWPWYTLHIYGDDPVEPAHLLFSRFVPEVCPNALRNAKTLAQEEAFAGKIIWLDGLTPNIWSAWKAFVLDYEHACRSRSLLERTVFCIPLTGDLALDPPAEDVCLSHHHWRGVVDRLDMLLFTSSLFQDRGMPTLQKRIVTSVVANLALWDPAVTERFASEDLEKILHPVPILQEIARGRGWCPADGGSPPYSWSKGMIDLMEEEESIHSAALALNDAKGIITRRIWSAEVGVMLPFVEERRQELLTRLAGVLMVPFTTRFGEVISDVHDLEIGHIESQLINNGITVHPNVRRLVQRLREIRNCLSHLEPLSLELLLGAGINTTTDKIL